MGFASGPIAVVLSFIIFGLIMAALGWTVALWSQRPARERVRRNTTECKSILVHVTDSLASERALDLACRFASDKRADIILAYVIEVPLMYALNAPLPESEEKARGVLHPTVLKVKQRRLACKSRIVRDRTTAGGLIELARETRAITLFVGFGGSLRAGLGELATTSDLFRRAPCEIVIARAPIPLQAKVFYTGRVIEPSIRS
jgi:nucleotide-binding universal stress UspA family protein